MDIETIKAESPNGSTHFKPECSTFKSHYIKVEGGKTYQWIEVLGGTSGWMDVPIDAPIGECVELNQ